MHTFYLVIELRYLLVHIISGISQDAVQALDLLVEPVVLTLILRVIRLQRFLQVGDLFEGLTQLLLGF